MSDEHPFVLIGDGNPGCLAGCLVLDVRLPGASGLNFQRELHNSGSELTSIIAVAHGDIPVSFRQ